LIDKEKQIVIAWTSVM